MLEGADGVAFVADSAPNREQANQLSLADLYNALRTRGREPKTVPLVFQWNKRDVNNALPIPLLEKTLNPEGRPSFAAVAVANQGVQETHRALITGVLQQLRGRARVRQRA